MIPNKDDVLKVVNFKTSRSGGKGGQNVNKVSSKVELIFNISSAPFLSDSEKSVLMERLSSRIDSENNIHVIAQEDRSQLLNKERTIKKLLSLVKSALAVQKKRVPTKTPKSVIRKRLDDKQSVSSKKDLRKRPQID